MGLWVCELPEETLHWTDGTYDLFGLPRGSRPDRGRTVLQYTEESRAALNHVRSRAIATGEGFTLDSEIVTPAGQHRWIRISATVECEYGHAVRLLGIKQDITEDRLAWERTRLLADYDAMTGLASRSRFQSRLVRMCEGRGSGALLLVDLDGFKQVNDTVGHAAGDDCLEKVAHRLIGACQGADLVARIGGDEFGILVGPDCERRMVEEMAGRVVRALRHPIEAGSRAFGLGGSVGVAFIGGRGAPEVYEMADAALYAAKRSGGSTVRVQVAWPGAPADRIIAN